MSLGQVNKHLRADVNGLADVGGPCEGVVAVVAVDTDVVLDHRTHVLPTKIINI